MSLILINSLFSGMRPCVSTRFFWTLMCSVLAGSLYVILTAYTVVAGSWMAGVVAWVSSPILLFVYALLFERMPVAAGGRGETVLAVFKNLFSIREQSWAFIFGDWLLLPGAFVIAALKWSVADYRIDVSLWWWWWILSLVIGGLAGTWFHFVVDKPAYSRVGRAASLQAPTKLLHDFVSYPVLAGGLLFALVPMVFELQWTWSSDWNLYTILVLIGLWIAIQFFDKPRARIPWTHPMYSLEYDACIMP